MKAQTAAGSFHSGFAQGDDLIRLHCNESPYGPPEAAVRAAHAELDAHGALYPDPESPRLRARIAEHVGLPPEMVSVGNGADELILLTALSFVRHNDTVLVTDTTFPGYRTSAAIAGAKVRTVGLADYRVPVVEFGAALSGGVRLAFLCNPLNPTGTVLSKEEVQRLINAAEQAGVVLVLDEAYMEFAGPAYEHGIQAVREGARIIVLRTFSKAWGLASLRAGYALGPADLIAKLQTTKQSLPFAVNRMAQRAAAAALDTPEFVEDVRHRTAEARERLCEGVRAIGADYVPSVTNFVVVRTGGDSADIARRLGEDHRILVRDLSIFGMHGHLRVSIGNTEEVDAFCTALAAVLSEVPFSPEEAVVAAPAQLIGDVARVSGGLGAPDRESLVPTLAPVDATELFNGYTGAAVVSALSELGVWDELADGRQSLDSLIVVTGAEQSKLLPMLRAAALLGYLELSADSVGITDAGRDISHRRGLFMWGVGGYGGLLSNLADVATGKARFGHEVPRDEARIALGTGQAGRRLMRPVEQRVVEELDFSHVADLGCGDGSRLTRLVSGGHGRRGLGIEISSDASAVASAQVAAAGYADSIEIVCADVLSAGRDRTFPGVDLVTCFLMLHDLFAETKDPAGVMRTLREVFPDAKRFLIADTMAQDWEHHSGSLPMFSLEFELVHAFMDTPIATRGTYEAAFAGAGLRVERRELFGTPTTWLYQLAVQ